MLLRWSRISRRNRARIVFYPTLIGLFAGGLAFATVMPGRTHRGPLPPATPRQRELAEELRKDVAALAGEARDGGIGVRRLGLRDSLARAERVVSDAFARAGHAPQRLPFDADGEEAANVEVVVPGARAPEEIVVVGAHYDSAAPAPGADDDASGVAILLALARTWGRGGHARPGRTLRLVAFANEEPPHFQNPTMGSLVYARACRARGDRVVAMLSLESLGYFRDEEGTQKYPPIVSFFYPSRGDFVGFVGDTSSRSLVRRAVGVFRTKAAFPSEGAALPGWVVGVGWSDQWSFWQVGYPGVMVTDTAPFRNPGYHTIQDRPETLDPERMARVTEGLEAVVADLVE